MENNINKENIPNEDNTTELFNLIQNIQSKLDNTQTEKQNQNSNEISKNVNVENNIPTENNTNNNFDFSNILNIIGNLNNTDSNTTTEKNTNENNGFNFDINTILKIQKLIQTFNKEDPKRKLILSLKPFLRKSRQDKLNEYIIILHIINAIEAFNRKGSD